MNTMSGPPCRLCGSPTRHLWRAPLLDFTVEYRECSNCMYVQTEEPVWLDRAYTQVINTADTGIVARNEVNARIAMATLVMLGRLRGCVVDCAGGVGLLVRMLRDRGVDALWSDPYCENVLARGFEYHGGRVDLVTAFEAFEHFVQPEQELAKLLEIGSTVLLSTEIMPIPAPAPGTWWYYAETHGQHIGFFRVRTLQELARRNGKYVVSDGQSYHLITDQPVPLWRWRLFLRGARVAAYFARRRLTSLTWSDHLHLGQSQARTEHH